MESLHRNEMQPQPDTIEGIGALTLVGGAYLAAACRGVAENFRVLIPTYYLPLGLSRAK